MNVLCVFRCLLISQPLLLACALGAAFFTGDPFADLEASDLSSYEPGALDRAFDWVEAELAPWAPIGIFLALLAVYFAALIGLYRCRRWARTLFLIGFLLGLALVPLTGGEPVRPIESIFDTLIVTIDGAILALAYLGPVADEIAASAPNKSLERTHD